MTSETGVTHIALDAVWVNERWMRQRCGWCGEILLDYDLKRLQTLDGDEEPPAQFPVGTLVYTLAGAKCFVGNVDRLPDDCCATVETKALDAVQPKPPIEFEEGVPFGEPRRVDCFHSYPGCNCDNGETIAEDARGKD